MEYPHPQSLCVGVYLSHCNSMNMHHAHNQISHEYAGKENISKTQMLKNHKKIKVQQDKKEELNI